MKKNIEEMLYNAIIGWFDDTADKYKYLDSEDFVNKVCETIGLSKSEYYRIMQLPWFVEK